MHNPIHMAMPYYGIQMAYNPKIKWGRKCKKHQYLSNQYISYCHSHQADKGDEATKLCNCVHVCKVYSLSVSTTFSHFMSLPKKFNFSYFILKSFSVSVSLSRLFMMLLACKNFPKVYEVSNFILFNLGRESIKYKVELRVKNVTKMLQSTLALHCVGLEKGWW